MTQLRFKSARLLPLVLLFLFAFTSAIPASAARKPRKTSAKRAATVPGAPLNNLPSATNPVRSAESNAGSDEKEQTGRARVESTRQRVEIKSRGADNWQKAKSGNALQTSDKVRTGDRSIARIRLEDGSKLLVLQNSEAQLEGLSTIQKTIRLLKGRVRAIVTHLKGGNQFKIKTPVGVASVRGTDFEVEFLEENQEMVVDVRNGSVGVSKLGDLENEVIINGGERLRFGAEGLIGDPVRTGAIPIERQDIRAEYRSTQARDAVVAAAAEESRNADYQVGKSLIDVDGSRVRVEEYIMRPAANQFKLVSLNERSNRFDYFTYKGTFNKNLPDDLSVALRDVGGKLGTTDPEYYLTDYESVTSNTIDSINDAGSGGHLVKITFDGTTYTLIDHADATKTKTIDAATLQSDGSYKVYNPISDTFSFVSAANLANALRISVLDGGSGNYRDLTSGDTAWRTRFNSTSFDINGHVKTAWAKKSSVSNVLAVDLDATFTGSPITTLSEAPSGSDRLHNRLSLYFDDGTRLTYDNYIIDDEGVIGGTDVFAGISSSAAYKTELEKWNYQQKVTSDEMNGRNINIIIDPRIGTRSGLIQ